MDLTADDLDSIRYSLRLVRVPVDCEREDLEQDAVLHLLRLPLTVPKTRGLVIWLARQRGKRFAMLAQDRHRPVGLGFDAHARPEWSIDRWRELLDLVGPRDAALLDMHYREGHSCAELARRMDVTREYAAFLVRRAGRRIGRVLQRKEPLMGCKKKKKGSGY